MKDIGPTPTQPEQTTADHAVAHLLRRVRNDPRLAYHMFMTETLSLAMRAYAEANGLDAATFRKDYEATVMTEAPRCVDCTMECNRG
jgi:hypothetical protein